MYLYLVLKLIYSYKSEACIALKKWTASRFNSCWTVTRMLNKLILLRNHINTVKITRFQTNIKTKDKSLSVIKKTICVGFLA